MLGDPSVMLIRASIPLMDGFDQRLMRIGRQRPTEPL